YNTFHIINRLINLWFVVWLIARLLTNFHFQVKRNTVQLFSIVPDWNFNSTGQLCQFFHCNLYSDRVCVLDVVTAKHHTTSKITLQDLKLKTQTRTAWSLSRFDFRAYNLNNIPSS